MQHCYSGYDSATDTARKAIANCLISCLGGIEGLCPIVVSIFDRIRRYTWLPNRHVLITDQANERIIEVDVATKGIVWQYGTTGVSGNGPNQLNNPNCAELLENGHILICDENNKRAIEVTRKIPLGGDIVWQYGSGDPNFRIRSCLRLRN